jgi:hypothetical protein
MCVCIYRQNDIVFMYVCVYIDKMTLSSCMFVYLYRYVYMCVYI